MAQELLNKQILWYKKKMQAFGGRMIITEHTFTYYQAPKWAMMFGAIGALIAGSSKGKELVGGQIKDLKFARGRDVNKKAYMLEVTNQAGDKFDFLFDDKLMAQVESVIKI